MSNKKQQDIESYRKKRRKKRKRKKNGKRALWALAFIIIAIAGAIIAISVISPELFDIYEPTRYVKQDLLGFTTTTTEPPTTTTTTEKLVDYLEHEDFALDNGKKGNYIGNLLNGGKVGMDAKYIYHIVDGAGIFRINPDTEGFKKVLGTDSTLSSLNLRGDYLYFVNESENALYRLKKETASPEKIADGIKLAYLYDDTIYFVNVYNGVGWMNIKDMDVKVLYHSEKEVTLVGVSTSRIFFSESDSLGNTEYRSVDKLGEDKPYRYRVGTANTDVCGMTIEDGFMYYYQRNDDGSYSLIRQKFGSPNAVVLLDNATDLSPVIVDSNRLYYVEVEDDNYRMKELNMNTSELKTMVSASDVSDSSLMIFQHGDEYDFVIGDGVYKASSNLTASTNTMRFADGKWSY